MPSDDTPTRRADADDYVTRAGLRAGARVFGRYRLDSLAGRGGMGVVWKAHDEKLERTVALKFLPEVVAEDAEAVRDLKRETMRCLELTHPYIVRVHDLVQDGSVAAIVMEYVDGESLAKRKAASPGGCLTLGKLRPLTGQLCAALDYAHRVAKVVHRDLKPANLLLTRDGQLKVTDFGIARSLSDTHTQLTGQAGNTSGTLAYMSPQQLRGEDPAASDDIYALGATLYELLTGKPPFHTGDVAWQIREETPKSVNTRLVALGIDPVPAAWEETIAACLAKDPAQRPPSAGEVARRLGMGPALPPSPGRLRTGAAGPRRHAALKWMLGAAAIIAIVATTLWLLHESAPVVLPREFTVTVDPADAAARLWLGPVSDVAVKEGRVVLKDLPDGEQELTIRAPGYQPFPTRVMVKDGRGRVEAKLVPVRGAVAFTARPGTQVTAVDERGRETRLGAVPASGVLEVENLLTVGRYTLRLEHPDCATVTVPGVELALGRTIKVAPVQTLLPGELRVFSVPTGAEVRVNGAVAGITPATIKNLSSEQALRLEVLLRGYRRVEQAVTLKPKEVRTLNFGTLVAESGGVELRFGNVDHGSVQVIIDGKPIEVGRAVPNAPLIVSALEVGDRTVEIVHPDYEPWRQTVSVRDQEMTAVNVELKPKPLTVGVSAAQAKQVFPEPGQVWENTLGMKFAPVPGTGVLFCIWETRVQDFEAFVKDTSYDAIGGMYSIGRDGWEQRGNTWRSPGFSQGPTHPVCGVSWDDAKAFCRWLTEKERRQGRLDSNQEYRLPTDAEWSVAVGLDEPAGGTPQIKDQQITGVYPWGTQWPPRGGAGNFAGSEVRDSNWPLAWGVISGYSDGYPRTAPVGSFTANRYGLYDLSGNVWEWCEDDYNASSNSRVLRGGSFDDLESDHLLSSYRKRNFPGVRADDYGFRCVVAVSAP